MTGELSKKEIYDLRQENRNLHKLHKAARTRVVFYQERDKKHVEEILLLKEIQTQQAGVIEHLKLRVAELERMIFGRRKKREEAPDTHDEHTPPAPRAPRDPSSYHRPIPREEDVTSREHHPIKSCPDCGETLTDKETTIAYEEDITLPPATPMKTLVKRTIECGYCRPCRAWRSSRVLSTTPITLGKNVRLYICYLSILLRLSFAQIRLHLATAHYFSISDGEIARILEKEAVRLRPEYEALKDRIRAQKGVHYDETSWKVQKEEMGNYTWVMTGTETMETVFVCGRSRGKGVAEEMQGNANHTGITDDYAPYRNLFSEHQLCWAHPHRKFRDLAHAGTLDDSVRAQCRVTYESFDRVYRGVRNALSQPKELRDTETLLLRFDDAGVADSRDPKKLATLKDSLRRNRDAYFTCLYDDGIPCDNNKAERSLRHLVLKRKISFGSKTQRGADTLGVLASVLLSLYWRVGENFFGEYVRLRGV